MKKIISKKYISFSLISLIILAASIHILVYFRIIPYAQFLSKSIRTYESVMRSAEISAVYYLVFLVIVLNEMNYLPFIAKRGNRFLLWCFFVYMTIKVFVAILNPFSFWTAFFAVLSFIFSLLCAGLLFNNKENE